MTYAYHYRPGYKSKEMLIEIYSGINGEETHAPFIANLLAALAPIKAELTDDIKDAFFNDEYWLTINTSLGTVTLTISIWDMAFIVSKQNQTAISEINELLKANSHFVFTEVDFKQYK